MSQELAHRAHNWHVVLRIFSDRVRCSFRYRKPLSDAFAKLRKATSPPAQIFMKFDIGVFYDILSREFRFRYNLTRVPAALHEDLCTFMTISPLILLRMSNMSGTICKENHNKFQVQKHYSFEMCAFYEILWKSMVGHRRKHNAAQKRCYLDTG